MYVCMFAHIWLYVSEFQARKLAKKDPAAMVAMCNELLEDPMLEE